jgi:hypothetical protein
MLTDRFSSIDVNKETSSLDYKFKSKPCHIRSKSNTGNVLSKICNNDDEYVTRLNFYEPNKIQRKLQTQKKYSIIDKLKSSQNTALLNELVSTVNKEEHLKKVSKRVQNLEYENKNEEIRKSLEKEKIANKRLLIKSYTEIERHKKELNELALEKELLLRRHSIIEEEASKKARKSLRMSHEEYDSFINIRKSMEVLLA